MHTVGRKEYGKHFSVALEQQAVRGSQGAAGGDQRVGGSGLRLAGIGWWAASSLA